MQRFANVVRTWIGLGLLVSHFHSAWAATLLVPDEYATIQAGLDAAAFGDTVLVAPGTYTDSEVRLDGWSTRACAFMPDGVVLRSVGGASVTTMDMLGMGSTQSATVWCTGIASELTEVDGFTITGAPVSARGAFVAGRVTFRHCIFRDMDAGGSSGAGVAANGDVDIIDCEFVNCVGNSGGGLYHSNGHLNLIRTVFRECTNNAAILNGNTSLPPESALIEHCVFENNWSSGGTGALGVSTYQAGVTVRGCRFEGNVAASNTGGGLLIGGPGAKVIEDCLFVSNAAEGTGLGGGLALGGTGSCLVRRNTFHGNSQQYRFSGGAAVYFQTAVIFENNVVTGTHSGQPAFRIGSLGSVTTSCNVYWDNDEGVGIPLSPTDREIDPLYCDPESGDFTVQENSPCVEPGALGCGQIGAFPAGCGIVSVESSSWSQIKDLYRRGETP
ncbi:MAG: right-handed parallel beta-helix repeat-containing protein [bacterium]